MNPLMKGGVPDCDSPVVWEGEVRSMQWFRSSYRMGFIRIGSETTPSPLISRPKRH